MNRLHVDLELIQKYNVPGPRYTSYPPATRFSETFTEAECAARGGSKVDGAKGWMVHAWVVPGWESPEGVFSPQHQGLV